jgi:hypothetical protein
MIGPAGCVPERNKGRSRPAFIGLAEERGSGQ